jgi:hypothetical protein
MLKKYRLAANTWLSYIKYFGEPDVDKCRKVHGKVLGPCGCKNLLQGGRKKNNDGVFYKLVTLYRKVLY